MAHEDDKRRRIGELEDVIKQRDQRIGELRDEVDELRELVTRLRDRSEEYDSSIEQWCEAFDMEMTEDGSWTWKPFLDEHNKLVDDYNAITVA
jgi:predicted  nucleic acid-binding Zn-ribbon protein